MHANQHQYYYAWNEQLMVKKEIVIIHASLQKKSCQVAIEHSSRNRHNWSIDRWGFIIIDMQNGNDGTTK